MIQNLRIQNNISYNGFHSLSLFLSLSLSLSLSLPIYLFIFVSIYLYVYYEERTRVLYVIPFLYKDHKS